MPNNNRLTAVDRCLVNTPTVTALPRTVGAMVYDDARESDVTSLEKLAAELGPRGFDTHLTTPDDRLPFLTVRNREAAQLTEMILADGGSFWWSWAERITGVANTGGAADAVARVLAARR